MFKGDDKNHTPKQLLVYAYLFMHRNMIDEVNFSLEELISGCGYSVNKYKDKNHVNLHDELLQMIKQNKSGHFNIKPKVDLRDINLTQRIVFYLGEIIVGDSESYTKLEFTDFNTLVSCKYKNKDNLLFVYLYIKSYFFERKENETAKDKPMGYAINYDRIAKDTGLERKTVIRAVECLNQLKLLYIHKTGGYKDSKGKIQNAPNIYTLWDSQNEVVYVLNKLKEIYKVDRFFEIKKQQKDGETN